MNTYFVGYDAREHEAAQVCAHSIHTHDAKARVIFLNHQELRQMGLFKRPWVTQPDGQMIDITDGKPFSTAFSHSRFLVFWLANALGCTGSCMFVDCDFIFRKDLGPLMDRQRKNSHKIGVVSRERKVEENSIKMDGMVQQNYNRKLWSAMFTFSPRKEWENLFTLQAVNTRPGRDLHAFLNLDASTFWEIDPSWHYIPSLDPKNPDPNAIHYSEFSPWLNPEKVDDYPDEFEAYHDAREKWLVRSSMAGQTDWGISVKTAVPLCPEG